MYMTSSSITISTNKQFDFEQRIETYVKTYSPKLYILSPCFGGICYVNFTISLIHTVQLLEKYKIPVVIEFCKNDSLISRARNNLIAKAMNDETMTHMMFIDNDITWEPCDVIKLLISDKPLVGGVYPLKKYNWNKLEEASQKKKSQQLDSLVSDLDYIKHNLLKYNINFLSNQLKIEKHNLTQVRHLATGFMMIQKQVIEKMSQAFPSTKYTDDVHFLNENENRYAYALFDTAVEEGHFLSEDWLFCDRWRKMGGEIWIDVSIRLTHQGLENYEGFFLSTLV